MTRQFNSIASAQPALHLENVHASIGGRRILQGITLTMQHGQILGLLGPNGSGKSTLIRCVTGQLSVGHGKVSINGECISNNPLKAKAQLGYAPDPQLLPLGLTVRQVLQLSACARRNDFAAAIPEITIAQAEKLALSRYLDSYISTLSLGTRQKAAILIGLMDAPALIVLDEVFNGLDPRSAVALKTLLKELADAGSAIVLATHGLELASSLLDQMLLLEEGRCVGFWGNDDFSVLKQQGSSAVEQAIVARLEHDTGQPVGA